MAALSWDEICERAIKNNKEIICEVDERYVDGSKLYKNRCNICGDEKIQPSSYITKCLKCSHNKYRSNKEEFIKKAIKVHGDRFNYDSAEYVNADTKVKILCNVCNEFIFQSPANHLMGKKCRTCANNKLRSTKEEFLDKARLAHGDKYNYDLAEYINCITKINIFCKTCDKYFVQSPENHLQGQGCRKCSEDKYRSTRDEFIKKSREKHGDKYNYDLVEYVNTNTKIKIICNKCNFIFSQRPDHHYTDGQGCPVCKESKGENRIAKYLLEKNIRFIPYKGFDDLRNVYPLKFDFYLIDLNLLLEYDGEFHYKALLGSTPEKKQQRLEDCQFRDKIKNEWALRNNIPLLRIPYWDFDRIEELLEAFIREHTNKKEIKQLSMEI
jgi:hypothetical protein